MDNKVFISYSHDSPEHENRVLELSDRLREDGIDANIDQYQSAPPEGWQLWMEKEIRDSQFVLLVCTETYLRRVMKEEEQGKGLGVIWESTIAIQHLYNAGVINEKFIPIVFTRENTIHIPIPLQPTTHYDVSTEKGYEALYRRLTNQPYTTKPKLGAKKKLAPRERKKGAPEVKVSTAKLPSTDPTLFGRELELIALDDAWNNQQINVLSLVAWGGVGKSALVNKWLSQLARDNYRGAERVYGWSFYSQGAAEGRQVSADPFIAAALEWFGDTDVTIGSPWDKGERLAELIKQQRTLLVLDGLEPLQNPPPVETGKIKDPGLTSLLRELARQNPGLVIISTRLAVDDLKDFIGSTAIEIDLEALSDEAGAAYLEHLGVDGSDDERKEASHDFGGHALALTLMGSYLKVVHRGDIRKRKEIPHVMDEQKQGKHARRVMQSYEVFLKDKPELDVLRLMGLFDRPAEKGALDALRKEPAIAGLTDALQKLKDAGWQFTVANLRDLRLLAAPDVIDPDELDSHPLLREHFGEQLKRGNPVAWHEGNNRLYEYYKKSAKEFPDTIEEMAPLFAAVLHGCQAGKHQEALVEVYWKRINRKEDFFSAKYLGAIGADLSALSFFFESPWHQPVLTLHEVWKGFVLHQAGFRLRTLGRLMEAEAVFREAEEMEKERSPELSFLYSLPGFLYCNLLLSQGNHEEVEGRANYNLGLIQQGVLMSDLLSVALTYLSLGYAHFLQSQREPNHPFAESLTYLNRAMDGLRQSGHQQYLPLSLLARAELYRLVGLFDKAQQDLGEAFSIATRGGMGLHLADCHLESARLYLVKDDKAKAHEHWEIAKKMIEEMGYHRRDKEVEEIEMSLRGME